jgi:hypothetical protein
MIPETNNLIEKFILGELEGNELNDFHILMKNSAEFAHEVEMNQEIAQSILEQDVMDLRSNLQTIFPNSKYQPGEHPLFDFAQNLNIPSVHNEFSDDISTSENSLQQIHLENHLKCITERIHQISSRTDRIQETILSGQINDFIFEEGIKDAILEKDIIELRNNLKEIVSRGYVSFSDYEIDQYRSNDLSQKQMMEISEFVECDKMMVNQIKLHEEIDRAISENDIFSLRNSIASIIDEEQQISYTEIKRIDDYLLQYLDENERSEFELLLEDNIKMKNEIVLNSEINEAIKEKDVMNLRSELSQISDENRQSTKIRKFIPENIQNRPLRYVGVAASAAAVITVGLFTFSNQKTTPDKLFQQAYQPYEATGLFRSAPLSNPSFIGIDLYNDRKYDDAIGQFDIVLNDNNEHPMCNFYTGLCYMGKNNFDDAVISFQKVITEKDNLFIEQAEWYMALSLLKTNERKEAYTILNRIIENKGYYHKNAKELIKKLK